MDMIRNSKGQFTKGCHWRTEKPWWERGWLFDQYINCARSASEIAMSGGVTENAILYWLHKHNIQRRNISEARAIKHWGQSGADNPMWNRRGELSPTWLGGITAERQAFYTSEAWKNACRNVWKRDKATCQRCRLMKDDSPDMPFHIHHIESFSNKDLRAHEPNLILMCETCHRFIHSKENTQRNFLC